MFWANSMIVSYLCFEQIVSYFCVLGFMYIYSFFINGKVKPLFLNDPLSASTVFSLEHDPNGTSQILSCKGTVGTGLVASGMGRFLACFLKCV